MNDSGDHNEIAVGFIRTEIVGVRYYHGIVSKYEEVVLTRQPQNPYDSNAIRVDNVHGVQIGHIPREMAARLAPLLDKKYIELQAVTISRKNTYTVDLELCVWVSSLENEGIVRTGLHGYLSAESAVKNTAVKLPQPPRTIPYTGPSWENLLAGGALFDTHSRDSLMEWLSVEQKKLAEMKMAEQPLELKTQLLPYQLQGLYWMQTCEDPQLPVAGSDQIVQFWRAVKSSRGGVVYENTAVMHSQVEQPKFYRGGILADDMGLGKTLQIISMIISDHQRQRMAVSGTGAHIIKPTLIVSPLSVVRNWQEQFEKHVLPDHISVYVYHGPDRVQDVDYLQQFDVVITTFNIVAIEKKTADVNSNSGVSTALPTKGGQKRKRKQQNATGSPLMEIEWRRVVLDEGHLIKSHQSLQTKAVCQLKAERRWIVSGTPIQNKVDDLYALLKFLDFSPFKSSEWWKRIISRPLLAGDPEARAKLRSKFICNQM